MAVSPNLYIDRRDPSANPANGLAINVKTAIIVPRFAKQVNILNGTTGSLQVHSTDEDDFHFTTINAGFERPFPAEEYKFHKGGTALWIKPSVSGLIILIWY